MTLLRRFRRPSFLRLLALGVLLLGVIAQPVMAAVGDVHEIGHGASLHAHADRHADNESDDGGGEDGPGLLHALMHAGHCCGHATAMPVSLPAWPALALPEPAPRFLPLLHARPGGDRLLRPPIAI